jgi:NAD(P)-dependent dehydrogenase (short-subunit alcohol dehydrogenase family)
MIDGNLIAVVTGGTGALGTAVVLRFARAGTRVAVPVLRGPSQPAHENRGLLPEPLLINADLSDEGAVSMFISRVEHDLGPVDILGRRPWA